MIHARVVIIDEFGPPRVSVEPRTMANIHRIIGCDTVDHATIRINGFKFNALVDDSGILNGRKIMAISPEGLKLYGTIWIEPYDDERFSLEDPEIEKRNIPRQYVRSISNFYPNRGYTTEGRVYIDLDLPVGGQEVLDDTMRLKEWSL